MLKFWSEAPAARTREIVADVATWAWVALWALIGAKIHDAISAFAEAGTVLQAGGTNIQGAGRQPRRCPRRRAAGRRRHRRRRNGRLRYRRAIRSSMSGASWSRCCSSIAAPAGAARRRRS